MDTTITITVVVKGDRDTATAAVASRLNPWFLEDSWSKTGKPAPFPLGSLLYWRQAVVNEDRASHAQNAVVKGA